jgi:ABC-type sulfate/molybdate transport systems ATPase subunit
LAEQVSAGPASDKALTEEQHAAMDRASAGTSRNHRHETPLLSVQLTYGVPRTDVYGERAPGELHLQVEFTLTQRRNVLFGPSGSGKTTLLRLLAGLLQPASGSIVLGGLTLTGTAAGVALPPGRRSIGYVTQEPALFPHLSVEANIAFGLHGLPRSVRRARVSGLLETFALESLACRMPLRLSGGERQRVALARALAPEPAMLLLDEPFTGLDVPLRERTTLALERYLVARDTLVLAVSHDVAEVYASGAEVLLLEAGRIAAQGPAHQVLAPHRERLLRQLGAAALADPRLSGSGGG